MGKVIGFIVAIIASVVGGLIVLGVFDDNGSSSGGPSTPSGFTLDMTADPELSDNEILFFIDTTPNVAKQIIVQRSNTNSGDDWARATDVRTSSSGTARVTYDLNGINVPVLYFRAYFPGDDSYRETKSRVLGPIGVCPRLSIC